MSIKPITVAAHDQPHQFEPLLPTRQWDDLCRRARPVIESTLRLQGAAHATTLQSLRTLVRAMNSYHSNRIEGQSTHPVHIARALRADFSEQPDIEAGCGPSTGALRAGVPTTTSTCQRQTWPAWVTWMVAAT